MTIAPDLRPAHLIAATQDTRTEQQIREDAEAERQAEELFRKERAREKAARETLRGGNNPEIHGYRFALYTRTSTDRQDQAVSQGWQENKAQQALDGRPGLGTIVARYHDDGISRSTSWFIRPAASRLLDAVRNHADEFDAVIVGEASRTFSGTHLEFVYPALANYGIRLYFPEINDFYDPHNSSHRLSLGVSGIMGESELRLIRERSKRALQNIADNPHDYRWLGGTAPYGYRLVKLHETAAGGANKEGSRGRGYTQTLAIDEEAQPIVAEIFSLALKGATTSSIANTLNARGIPTPRKAAKWSSGTLSTMLRNPTYAGLCMLGRRPVERAPIDPDRPELGDEIVRNLNRNFYDEISTTIKYPQYITRTQFLIIGTQLSERNTFRPGQIRRKHKKATVRPLTGKERFAFRGCLTTDGYTMTGEMSLKKIRYRTNRTGAPRVSIYEEHIKEPLHEWLSTCLSRKHLLPLAQAVAAGKMENDAVVAKIQQQQKSLNQKINNLVAAVESANDRATRIRYENLVQERTRELAKLNANLATRRSELLDTKQVIQLFAELDAATRPKILNEASPRLLHELYVALGLTLDYNHERREITVSIAPETTFSTDFRAPTSPQKSEVGDLHKRAWRDSNPQPSDP